MLIEINYIKLIISTNIDQLTSQLLWQCKEPTDNGAYITQLIIKLNQQPYDLYKEHA
jgi:hypothetical protein